jgi:ribosomal peptide maturation radical SAM protein 1
MVRDLDALPYPDYDDYFAALDDAGLRDATPVAVVVETSRGCWWGAKHHCTFCGLNGETMAFRSKSPERAYDEIVHLTRHHSVARLGCVDNIVDMKYIDTLFPRLAESGLELDLFYEVKANLRRDQLQKMYAGGMRQIQPGIESFSDQVLKLMRKGVSGFQNIQLLRWSQEVGIGCAWNLIGGFPDEDPAEYGRMAAMLPLLAHLEPPCSAAQLRLDRFSPFHAAPDAFGFRNVRPARAYFYVFPFGRREIARLAYFFDFDYADGRDPQDYLEPVQRVVQRWWEARLADPRPRLDARFDAEGVTVQDSRPVARAAEHRLAGVAAQVLLRCDVASTVPGLLRQPELADHEPEVRAALDRLVADRLVLAHDDHYLSLPVFLERPTPPVAPPPHAALAVAPPPAAEPLLRLV